LLLTKNLAPKSHSGLISLFGEHFIKTDIFSKEMGRHLNRAHDKRLIGDYGTSIIIKKNEAQAQGLLNIGQDWMVKWRFIIDKISQLISAQGKKIVVFNVEAERDPRSQFEKYQATLRKRERHL